MPGRVEQDPDRQDAVRQVNPSGPLGPDDPMTESFQQLFEQSLASQQIKPGQILTGIIVDMNADVVIVSVGLKSEAVIPAEQFRNEHGEVDVAIGQEVEVALDAVEDGSGETRLSREKAKRARTWTRLEEAFTKGEIVKGVINGRVKGGFTVELDNVRAFLPGSLVDVRPVRDPSYLEGKELEFKVIKLDQRRNNVVVSRRAVVEQEYSAERSQLLDNLKEGDVVKGAVKNLTDYGAFVDLGGIDGLLHITDMAWKRVKHPSEIVKVGDEIDVRILKFDRERQRVSLGIKQLGADPVAEHRPALSAEYPPVRQGHEHRRLRLLRGDRGGRRRPGPRLRDGLDQQERESGQGGARRRGSRGDGPRHRRGAPPHLARPQAVQGRTRGASSRRASTAATSVSGQIKSITDFGIFIGLSGGIDGLVHLSDISWDRPGEEAVRDYQKGQTVEAMVLSIDPERERISLGIKQMAKDPISAYLADHPKGSIVKGTVKEVDARGAIIDLGDGIEGSLRASELARDRVEDARTVLKVGDQVEARFVGRRPQEPRDRAVDQGDRGRGRGRGGAAVSRHRFGDRHLAR